MTDARLVEIRDALEVAKRPTGPSVSTECYVPDVSDLLVEVASLRAEVERLRGALRPFAELSPSFADAYGLDRECRAAQLALSRPGTEGAIDAARGAK